MPKVSVIIPAYNVELYCSECLNSILGQTLSDIEIICVDDGSTDATPDILRYYARKDPRVTFIRQENAGAGAARNKGLELARGEYLQFCDPDDWCDADMLASFYATASTTHADVVIASLSPWVDSVASAIPPKRMELPPAIVAQLTEKNAFDVDELSEQLFTIGGNSPCNKFFRRAVAMEKGLRFQPLRRTNDLLFVKAFLANSKLIAFIDKAYYHYRRGIQSATTNDALSDSFMFACEALRGRLVADGLFDKFRKTYCELAVGSFVFNFKSIQNAAFRERWYSELRPRLLRLVPTDEDLGALTGVHECFRTVYKAMTRGADVMTVARILDRDHNKKPCRSHACPTLAEYRDELKDVLHRGDRLMVEVCELKKSFAYRVGLFFTWPLRTVKGLLSRAATRKTK